MIRGVDIKLNHLEKLSFSVLERKIEAIYHVGVRNASLVGKYTKHFVL